MKAVMTEKEWSPYLCCNDHRSELLCGADFMLYSNKKNLSSAGFWFEKLKFLSIMW